MGYELELSDLSRAGSMTVRLAKLKMEAACLQNSWDGCWPKDEVLTLCKQFADQMGLENTGNVQARMKQKGYVPPVNRFEYVLEKNQDFMSIAFVRGAERVEGKIKTDKFGSAAVACPSCGAETKGKTSLAHNIIPQAVWAEIIDAAVKDFRGVVESKGLMKIKDSRGRSLVTGSDSFQTFYTDGKQKLLPADELITKSPKTMTQLRAINNHYGAQANAGQQCPNCELIQSNATLLQRAKLIQDKAIPDEYFSKIPQSTFVGAQWSTLTVDPLRGGESALVKATLRQVGRYMQGLEERLAKLFEAQGKVAPRKDGEKVEPLLFLIWDHMQEFTWSFRGVALKMCQMPYSRTDTALRPKAVTL